MTTIYRCLNGTCKFMENLRCTLDEIQIDHGGTCLEFMENGWEEEEI